MNLSELKKILKENRLWAKKALGQNFLLDEKVLGKIVGAADLSSEDTVVEIGPGLGVLTEELGQRAKLVLAIEKDYDFVEWLRKRFKHFKNIKIIHDDILHFPISNIQYPISKQTQNPNDQNSKQFNNLTMQQCNHYKVVANLPYNITSPVIRKFLESGVGGVGKALTSLSSMVLMVQKEVAERICAKSGNSERGMLTVMVEFYAQAEIIEIVDRSCFWPVPKVDSAILKLTPYTLPLIPQKNIDSKIFFRIVKAGFSQKRRQIHHPLRASLHLEKPQIYDILKKTKIDPMLRAEDLSLEDWIRLYKIINKL